MEIMSPAGSYESLHAAIKAGAGSVYFGVEQLNMRSRTVNFKLRDLKKIADICNKNNVKSYLTLNTIIYDDDLKLMKKICDKAKESKITAIIASDISVMQYAKFIGLEVHISTQQNISNIEAVKFFSKYADVIVLARELTLEQIKKICKEIKESNIRGPSGNLVKIEVFCHGALCVSISGKCYMSLALYNESANRGKCLQTCRRSYKVTDEETGDELSVDNHHIMSPKDLCTISMLDKLVNVGISILKIEGRGRSPEYVYTTTKVYKEALESIKNKSYTKEKIKEWTKQLESVYNRGFWQNGYYLGKKLGEWSNIYGSDASKEKDFIGSVTNYYAKINVAEITLVKDLEKPKCLLIMGPTTGVEEIKLENNLSGKKGDKITIKTKDRVRKNDKAYVLNEKK